MQAHHSYRGIEIRTIATNRVVLFDPTAGQLLNGGRAVHPSIVEERVDALLTVNTRSFMSDLITVLASTEMNRC
jgi:hypothetical protein